MTKLKLMHLPKNITLMFRIAKQTIYFFRKKKKKYLINFIIKDSGK